MEIKCSIQRGETFHLSPNKNICTTAQMKNYQYLF